MIFFSNNIDIQELRDLRGRQFKEKTGWRKIECQVQPRRACGSRVQRPDAAGHSWKKSERLLRTPRIHEALNALMPMPVSYLPEDCDRLTDAYGFLRKLINGLRMLRGSAKDLFLPAVGSKEFDPPCKTDGV